MPTNILALPYQAFDFITFALTDWRDAVAIMVGGPAVPYRNAGAQGDGALTVAVQAAGRTPGIYTVAITGSGANAAFTFADPSGAILDVGRVGVPLTSAGLTFTVAQGATPFTVGDAFSVVLPARPLDLTGIRLDLMLRADPDRAAIALALTSDPDADLNPGTIINGGVGGQIALDVPQAAMGALAPGSYRYDLVATADGVTVPVASGAVDHRQTITYI